MTTENKVYLGDSVYAEFDGYAIILTTENGLPSDPSNTIILEPEILERLTEYSASQYKPKEKPSASS